MDLKPVNVYGLSKYEIDKFMIRESEKMIFLPNNVLIKGYRFHNVYGEKESHKGSMKSIVHQWIDQAFDNQNIVMHYPLIEDNHTGRDFIYVNDVCNLIINDILSEEKNELRYQIKDVGSGVFTPFYDAA